MLPALVNYLCILLSILISIYLAKRKYSNDPMAMRLRASYVVIFVSLGFLLFLHAPLFYELLKGYKWTNSVFDSKFQFGILMISINFLLQIILLNYLDSLFSQMIVPSVISFLLWVVLMPWFGVGIIYFLWVMVFSGAMGGFIVCSGLFVKVDLVIQQISRLKDETKRLTLIDTVKADMNLYAKIGAISYFGLAASMGVAMSILFQGGGSVLISPPHQLNASRFVIGFAFITVGMGIWCVRPYLRSYEKIVFSLKSI